MRGEEMSYQGSRVAYFMQAKADLMHACHEISECRRGRS